MIRSFGNSETEKIFQRRFSKKLPEAIQRTALRKLLMLHRSKTLRDMAALPNNCLEELKGKRKGQYSVRINEQWRICFHWKESDAYRVEIIDYH